MPLGEGQLTLLRQREVDGLLMMQNEATKGFISGVTIVTQDQAAANAPAFQRISNEPAPAVAPGIIPFPGAGAGAGPALASVVTRTPDGRTAWANYRGGQPEVTYVFADGTPDTQSEPFSLTTAEAKSVVALAQAGGGTFNRQVGNRQQPLTVPPVAGGSIAVKAQPVEPIAALLIDDGGDGSDLAWFTVFALDGSYEVVVLGDEVTRTRYTAEGEIIPSSFGNDGGGAFGNSVDGGPIAVPSAPGIGRRVALAVP